jgi:hypothetical protein
MTSEKLYIAEGKRVVVFDASFQYDHASVVLDASSWMLTTEYLL